LYMIPKSESIPVDVSSIFKERANGWHYPLVGGTRERYFDGTSFKLRKLLKNAHAKRQPQLQCTTPALAGGARDRAGSTPAYVAEVHAVLACFAELALIDSWKSFLNNHRRAKIENVH
jgi:hypothetical protein